MSRSPRQPEEFRDFSLGQYHPRENMGIDFNSAVHLLVLLILASVLILQTFANIGIRDVLFLAVFTSYTKKYL